MTEDYENTGKTKVEIARANKIRGLSSRYEIAVTHEVYSSLVSFARSINTMSISFDAMLDGTTELFSMYRFTTEDKSRSNIFVHTDKFGYEEMISINTFGPKDTNVNVITTEGHSFSFYPVDDLDKFEIGSLISHILTRILKLNSKLETDEDKEISEVIFEYTKMLYEKYK